MEFWTDKLGKAGEESWSLALFGKYAKRSGRTKENGGNTAERGL